MIFYIILLLFVLVCCDVCVGSKIHENHFPCQMILQNYSDSLGESGESAPTENHNLELENQELKLCQRGLSENNLAGPIGSWAGKLKNLERLNLSNNNEAQQPMQIP